ncbi:DUF2147 domain-containing protein [Piscirickettsia salmonis]|uniref:DUF2147 domain-containing protein n=1 Tax=Piscirickettsia salmonis TaxID=1238 RepID=UPI001E640068|nr:DUF2147 domain-containing protein [Piscirickettsia salmonis]
MVIGRPSITIPIVQALLNKFAQNSIYLSSQQATRYFGKLPLRVVMRFVFFRSKLRGIRPLAIEIYTAKSKVNGKTIDVLNGKIYGTYLYGEKRHHPAPRCKKCDGKLANAAIVGLPIITHFRKTADNRWQAGILLSPRTGSTYENATLSLANNNQLLNVHVKVGFFSKTQVWHRILPSLIKEIKQSQQQADFKLLTQ